MPFFHLITLISNAHLYLCPPHGPSVAFVHLAMDCGDRSLRGEAQEVFGAWGFSSLALGSPRHAGTIDAAAASAFCPEEAVDRNGHLFLERPVFIEISPARSVAVKRLPAPCRGVVQSPEQTCTTARMPQARLPTRHIPSSRCRRHSLAGVFVFFVSRIW